MHVSAWPCFPSISVWAWGLSTGPGPQLPLSRLRGTRVCSPLALPSSLLSLCWEPGSPCYLRSTGLAPAPRDGGTAAVHTDDSEGSSPEMCLEVRSRPWQGRCFVELLCLLARATGGAFLVLVAALSSRPLPEPLAREQRWECCPQGTGAIAVPCSSVVGKGDVFSGALGAARSGVASRA